MKRNLLIILVGVSILGCSFNDSAKNTNVNDIKNVKNVTIRSGSQVTKNQVNSHNLITSSSYQNTYGAVNSRSYLYDDTKELNTIIKENSVTGRDYFYITTVKNRSNNQITQKIKSTSDSRGTKKELTVNYIYDDNGKLLGMIQTDANGNVIAKGVNN